MFLCLLTFLYIFFFFFKAKDGIRDYKVTGVQTCALPISPGAVGVHVRARRRRPAEPRADLVPRDEALDQTRPVERPLFRDGEGAGDDVDRGVATAETIALVHLERDAGGGVHERRPAGGRLRTVAEQRGDAVGRARGRKPREVVVLGQRAAGDDGAERVEQDPLGGLDGGSGKRVDAHLGRDLGESIEVVGHWSERREAGALRGWRACVGSWLDGARLCPRHAPPGGPRG